MSLGQVVFGLASVALGVQQLHKGARTLSGVAGNSRARRRRPRPGLGELSRSGHALTDVGPLRVRVKKIRTLEDRIEALRKLVNDGKKDPVVYAFARKAVNGRCGRDWCVSEKDTLGELRALYKAIRKNVRYTSDIANIDSYQTPSKTLKLHTGDCDDYSSLAASAALSLGIPVRFKVIRTKGARDWNHIYTEMGIPRQRPTKWVPFDASVAKSLGWEAPRGAVAAARVFPLR